MKLIKIIAPLVITTLVANNSQATITDSTYPWGTFSGGKGAGVSYQSYTGGESKLFTVEIGHSKSGQQRIYFTNSYTKQLDICRPAGISIPENFTFIFNNQAVKMTAYCNSFRDTHSNYRSFTPETERGLNYVVNLFKTANKPIKIEFNNEVIFIPVNGFTKIWNSGGGNAI